MESRFTGIWGPNHASYIARSQTNTVIYEGAAYNKNSAGFKAFQKQVLNIR